MIKRIDFNDPDFNFEKLELIGKSGKVYKNHSIAAGRMAAWEKAWLSAQFNMNPAMIFKTAHDVQGHLKANDVYNASVKNYLLLEGGGRIIDGRPHYQFELLAIMYSCEGEDITTITDTQIKEKIEDLSHYEASDLFIVASGRMLAFTKDYEESYRATLERLNALLSQLSNNPPQTATQTDQKKKK